MDKKSVLLINPRVCSGRAIRMPVSLLALAAVLEGKYEYQFIDGNIDPKPIQTALGSLGRNHVGLIGVSVMPGPQVATAIEISSALRAAHPDVPILWGGYFPTMYPEAAINAPYVDYLARGQGEETLLELLAVLPNAVKDVRGLTWKEGQQIIHNPDRQFRPPDEFPPFPYERLENMRLYLRPSFMGTKTGVHQAAIGCRYHCKFCGVVSMFSGQTKLQTPGRLVQAVTTLRDHYGATAMQFYDNNFFDREETSLPILDAMSSVRMPWWCYARADALAKFSTTTWEKVRRSNLKMAFIGVDGVSNDVLVKLKKGSQVEHTLEAVARMREYGVIPELSFILGGPEDPEGEIEKTFAFVRKVKKLYPECEIILYFYSPTPQRDPAALQADVSGTRLPALKTYGPDGPALPTTPEEWTQPRWVAWVCHQDAPWLTSKMRRRVKDFANVLYCRYPTVQDYHTPAWGKALLKTLASWRYSSGHYSRAWEIDVARRLIPLREPQKESL
jgi:anaerobic magnesium-protoporphyrin IX monomethyl ester cyclase